jgi:glucose/arabinose dehydrogenase
MRDDVKANIIFYTGITLSAFVLIALIILGVFFNFNREPSPRGTDELEENGKERNEDEEGKNSVSFLSLPEDFSISVFAENVPGARVMAFDSMGNMWVSRTEYGAITLLTIENNNVTAQDDIFRNLNNPHGLAFDPQNPFLLYFAEEDSVSKVEIYAEGEPQKIADLPSGEGHFTRSLLVGPDNRLYVSIGSSCNVCVEEDDRRAKIFVMDRDGDNFQEFASGLRNAVFMATHPITDDIWVSEMGRDYLGDNLPPDEINILEEAQNYGWPYCYGKQVYDPTVGGGSENFCGQAESSHIDIQAHSAPLGLQFIPEEGWPEDFWFDLLVAYHGSWNRSVPTGYKIVRMELDENGNPQGDDFKKDFIDGWLQEDGEVLGRPVDILVQPGGIIYVSDDEAGKIYKAVYKGN